VIASHNPRLASLSRHHDENPRTATPFLSHPYKCPLPQPLSFDILTNARGVWGLRISYPPFLLPISLSRAKSAFANPLFSNRCALFQIPYPVSLLLAVLTKTTGCTPTLPILERLQPPCPTLRARSNTANYLLVAQPLLAVRFHQSQVTSHRSPLLRYTGGLRHRPNS